MTSTLEDVSYLLRLPISEVVEAVEAVNVNDSWRAELSNRFTGVMVPPDCQPPLDQAFESLRDQIDLA
jgi:hypothetical protein